MRHSVQLGSRDRARSNSGAAYMDSKEAFTRQVAVKGVRMVDKMPKTYETAGETAQEWRGQGMWMKRYWHSRQTIPVL